MAAHVPISCSMIVIQWDIKQRGHEYECTRFNHRSRRPRTLSPIVVNFGTKVKHSLRYHKLTQISYLSPLVHFVHTRFTVGHAIYPSPTLDSELPIKEVVSLIMFVIMGHVIFNGCRLIWIGTIETYSLRFKMNFAFGEISLKLCQTN